MNYKTRALAVVVAATLSSAAMAVDGTIEFAGEIAAATCKAELEGGAKTVVLPMVTTGALSATAQTAGQTAFTIALTNCTGPAKTAAAFFEAGSTVETRNGIGILKNTTLDGSNVYLQLVDVKTGQAIQAGNVNQVTSTSRIDITNGGSIATGNISLPYAVQYFALLGPATAGKVTSSVTYSINYQ